MEASEAKHGIEFIQVFIRGPFKSNEWRKRVSFSERPDFLKMEESLIRKKAE